MRMKSNNHLFGCLRGIRRQISKSTALLRHVLKDIATVTVIRMPVLHLDTRLLELDLNLVDLVVRLFIGTQRIR